jgi:hypothetical protein
MLNLYRTDPSTSKLFCSGFDFYVDQIAKNNGNNKNIRSLGRSLYGEALIGGLAVLLINFRSPNYGILLSKILRNVVDVILRNLFRYYYYGKNCKVFIP